MHTLRNRIFFFGSTLAAGAASLALYRYMLENCFDAKGLMIAGNLPMKLLWVIGIGFAAVLLPLLTTIGGDGSYADNFPRSMFSGALMIAAGAVLFSGIPGLGLEQALETTGYETPWVVMVQALTGVALKLLPWVAAGSMVVLGLFRMAGRKPLFLFSCIVCLFYMLMLVTNYRLWSADPRLYEYGYQALAGILLMLCAFHRTSCDGDVIQRKKLLFTGLAAAMCCITAMGGGYLTDFYGSGALWALGCLCSCGVLPPDPEEDVEAAEAPDEAVSE